MDPETSLTAKELERKKLALPSDPEFSPPAALPPAVATAPVAVPVEPDWARYIRWINLWPLLTFIVLSISAAIAWNVFNEARQQNVAQRGGAIRQQVLLRQSIDQNTIAAVYTMGNETTKFLMQYPELRPYFEAIDDYRTHHQKADPGQRQAELYRRFDNEPPLTKHRVWMFCQMLGDFYEYTYVFRQLLPERDWDGWWYYFCDTYDESAFLREYFVKRPTWYTIDEVLGLPEAKRVAWYEEDKKLTAKLAAERK